MSRCDGALKSPLKSCHNIAYPEFETDPHPALQRSVKLSLRTREIDCFDYAASTNPPILHRKEAFLTAGHPLYAKFARLTQQEEKHGLLDDTATIGTKDGWQARLTERGFLLRRPSTRPAMIHGSTPKPAKNRGDFNRR